MSCSADESLDFESQQALCPSSARSFSTASSFHPYIPKFGRSTPHPAPESMANLDPVICPSSLMAYEPTPPTSDLEDYFPLDVKTEFASALPGCTSTMLRTPTERYEPSMKIAFQHQMNDSMFHGMESKQPSSHPLHQYLFPIQHMRQPPSEVSTGSYILPSSDFDAFQACQTWAGESETNHAMPAFMDPPVGTRCSPAAFGHATALRQMPSSGACHLCWLLLDRGRFRGFRYRLLPFWFRLFRPVCRAPVSALWELSITRAQKTLSPLRTTSKALGLNRLDACCLNQLWVSHYASFRGYPYLWRLLQW